MSARVGIGHCFRHHEINGAAQKLFETILQPEVVVQSRPSVPVQEFNQEIEVALCDLEVFAGS